ncbi:MAG: DMT family transporter [Burkholderiales bacterium]
MKTLKPLRYAYAGIVASTFFWGTNFNAGAYIISHVPPISAAIERFVIATILLFLIFGPRGKLRGAVLQKNLWVYVVLGLLGVACFNMATFFGLQTTTPINGVLILATTPLWTTILAALLEGERIDLMRGCGIVCGLFGVGFVITRGDLGVLLAHKIVVGDVIILAGSIAWALNTVISRRFVVEATPLETTAFSMLFGTIGLVILGSLFEKPISAIAAAPPGVHGAILYLAVCGSMMAYLLWFNGIQRIGSARTAIFFNLAPVFTMAVSTVLGVPPNGWQMIGAIAVIIGVVLASGMLGSRVILPYVAKI